MKRVLTACIIPAIAFLFAFLLYSFQTQEVEKNETKPLTYHAIKSLKVYNYELPAFKLDDQVFLDNFNSELDQTYWNIVKRGDNYNNELQYYHPNNVTTSNGKLKLTAKKEFVRNHYYTSGQITTQDKLSFKYGTIEFRAKVPSGKGLFSAVWLLPKDKSRKFPEIDILEVIGSQPRTIYMVNHWKNKNETLTDYGTFPIKDEGFHVYRLDWTEEKLTWFIDEQKIFSTTKQVPQQTMYLLINLAVGGNWPGEPNEKTVLPNTFELDYIKIYSPSWKE
ncbi:glycoside hydrolase family 16 protein [Aquibacillus salsiterrae]|uniref:Glycoside hydrolase family 16 protein n=1 Tax=Aquibacillus salsiterrae TaxID=2950439 RepID=A0A9X4AF22_9BACI|nr:glycoside hydrolase family 16 protein [Aquibacillus salsiterrae]MDC3417547.1 glycoside hydrolase family 16 protein [Aquibacillus salsiterrae]